MQHWQVGIQVLYQVRRVHKLKFCNRKKWELFLRERTNQCNADKTWLCEKLELLTPCSGLIFSSVSMSESRNSKVLDLCTYLLAIWCPVCQSERGWFSKNIIILQDNEEYSNPYASTLWLTSQTWKNGQGSNILQFKSFHLHNFHNA